MEGDNRTPQDLSLGTSSMVPSNALVTGKNDKSTQSIPPAQTGLFGPLGCLPNEILCLIGRHTKLELGNLCETPDKVFARKQEIKEANISLLNLSRVSQHFRKVFLPIFWETTTFMLTQYEGPVPIMTNDLIRCTTYSAFSFDPGRSAPLIRRLALGPETEYLTPIYALPQLLEFPCLESLEIHVAEVGDANGWQKTIGAPWCDWSMIPHMIDIPNESMVREAWAPFKKAMPALKEIKVIRADLFDDGFTGLLHGHGRAKMQLEDRAAQLSCELRKVPISIFVGCPDFLLSPNAPTRIVELGDLKIFLESWDKMCIDAILAP